MSKTRRLVAVVVIVGALLAVVVVSQGAADDGLTPEEKLGRDLYFDEDLAEPEGESPGQSCASCHTPDVGFDDPDSDLPVSEGVIPGLFGNRNSPVSAYAMYAPIRYEDDEGLYVGGQFWDSRATGDLLGDPLADQAIGPFLNPVEMANKDSACVVWKVCQATDYEYGLGDIYAEACDIDWPADVAAICDEAEEYLPLESDERAKADAAYDNIGRAIATFERTEMFGEFSSKYDAYLQACLAAGGSPDGCAKGADKVAQQVGKKFFSAAEWKGFELFMNENNNNDGVLEQGEGAMCVLCHVADWTEDPGNVVVPSWAPTGMVPPMFTDFTYDNLGVPKNPEIEDLIGPQDPDLGLGAVVGEEENGKFKVMTLRNIGMTAPYAHNGLFRSVKEITHFYNTRDALPACDPALVKNPKPGNNCWDPAEVPGTVNFDELGNLGLSDKDEDSLVEFMKTLSDGWAP